MCSQINEGYRDRFINIHILQFFIEMEELLEFIKTEHNRLMKFYNFQDKTQITYPMTLKVMEEVGELSQAILHTNSLQRKEKLEKKDIKLGEEFADVLFTTLLLAENFNIDIKSELKNKIEIIKNRNY